MTFRNASGNGIISNLTVRASRCKRHCISVAITTSRAIRNRFAIATGPRPLKIPRRRGAVTGGGNTGSACALGLGIANGQSDASRAISRPISVTLILSGDNSVGCYVGNSRPSCSPYENSGTIHSTTLGTTIAAFLGNISVRGRAVTGTSGGMRISLIDFTGATSALDRLASSMVALGAEIGDLGPRNTAGATTNFHRTGSALSGSGQAGTVGCMIFFASNIPAADDTFSGAITGGALAVTGRLGSTGINICDMNVFSNTSADMASYG